MTEGASLFIKHQPSIIQYINIRKLLSRMSFIFFTLNCHGCPQARAPRWYLVTGASGISHYSKIKYGESKDNIKTRQNFRKCFSGTFSPEELREGSWLYRFLRWYRKCCCLSIFDASSAFSVLFLAKFCTPWYLRSSELRRIQRNIYRKSHLVHLIIP